MTKSNPLVDLTLIIFSNTEKAYLMGDTEDRDKAEWVPKSVVEIEETGRTVREVRDGVKTPYDRPVVIATMPQSWAEDKGWV